MASISSHVSEPTTLGRGSDVLDTRPVSPASTGARPISNQPGVPSTSSDSPCQDERPQQQPAAINNPADSSSHLIGRNDEDPQIPPQCARRPWFSVWSLEMMAVMDATLSLIAMVLILRQYDGKPLPRWPLDISINSVLSILSAIYKVSVFFTVASCIGQLQWSWFQGRTRRLMDWVGYDDATRGPWGAISLVWSQKGCQPLVMLASVVLIASVIVEPFIQELAKVTDCSVVMASHAAALPRTNFLPAPVYLEMGRVPPELITDIQTASNQGTYAPELTVTGIVCSTGNCTFDHKYSTLGYCSSCEDTSQLIHIERNIFETTDNESEVYNRDTHTHQHNDTISTVSGGPTMNFSSIEWDRRGYGTLAVVSSTGPASPLSLAHQLYFLAGETKFTENGTTVTGRSEPGCESQGISRSWRCGGFGAVQCIVGPCIREYTAQIKAGRVVETLIGTSDIAQDWTVSTGPDGSTADLGLLDLECITAEERGQLQAKTTNSDSSSDVGRSNNDNRYTSQFNAALDSDPSWKDELLERQCFYHINEDVATNYMPQAFEDQFTGNVNASGVWAGTGGFEAPPHLLHAYNNGVVDFERIEGIYNNISDAVTNYIRTKSAAGGDPKYSRPAEGETRHYATCMAVQWKWIALPALLIVTAAGLLASVVLVTATRRLPTWKSSPIVWLLRGPGADHVFLHQGPEGGKEKKKEEKKGGGNDQDTLEGVQERAKDLGVSLRHRDGGFRIEEVD